MPYVEFHDGSVDLGWVGGIFTDHYSGLYRIPDNGNFDMRYISLYDLYAKTDKITAAIDSNGARFYPISSAYLDIQASANPDNGDYSRHDVESLVHVYTLLGDWDAATVTNNDLPDENSIAHNVVVNTNVYTGWTPYWRLTLADASEIQKLYHYGLVLRNDGLPPEYNPAPEVAAGRHNDGGQYSVNIFSPNLIVFFASKTKIHVVPTGVPSTGYINTAVAQQFRWALAQSKPALETPAQTQAVIEYYNTDSESAASAHSVTISGDTQEYTFAAGTFVGGGLTWRVTVTDETGVSTASPWYSVETGEALPTAVPLSPINAVVDPSAEITFDWNHVISTGTVPTRADIQISTDASTWTNFATVTGEATEYTAPAYTLTSGTYYWRVRSYNSVDVAGNWSKHAAFVALGKPKTPSMTANNRNRPTLTWTASEQSAFEARIDGQDNIKVYGTARNYKWHDYLEPGTHLVELRVQNAFGYWSEWAQWTITSPTTHKIDTFTATVQGTEVLLTFSDVRGASDIYPIEWWIYRDGTTIAKLSGNPGSFVDHYVSAGVHRYKARAVYSTGTYTYVSKEIALTIALDSIYLYDIQTGASIECPYTADGDGEISRSYGRNSTPIHYNGSGYPHLDIGQALTETYTFKPVFPDGEMSGAQIAALVGKPIHVRDPYGTALFGYVTGLSHSRHPDRETLSVQITRIAMTEVEANAI